MRGEFPQTELADDQDEERSDTNDEPSGDELPLEVIESRQERILNVRSETEPVEAVLEKLDTLERRESLDVVSPTALVPLYDELDERDLQYEAVRLGADNWRIGITLESTDGQCGERLRRPRRERLPQDDDRLRRTSPGPTR